MSKNIYFLNRIFSILILTISSFSLQAATFDLPTNGDNVVGDMKIIISQKNDNLQKLARQFDIGYFEIIDANRTLDKKNKLAPGTKVRIPRRFILPGNTRKGLVINLSEFRLYYYLQNNKVITEPIGIGRIGWKTPLGTTKIIEKKANPTWHPPKAVRKEALRLGLHLPDTVPPGANNPLGHYMMRLGWYSYLIHGTNNPDGIGKRVTAGCIRMYPEDIKTLFPLIPVGTQVTIIDEPIKAGHFGNQFLVEVHKPLEERGGFHDKDTINLIEEMSALIKEKSAHVKWKYALKAVNEQTGIPTIVGQYKKLEKTTT